jgi:ArsR family transcriptional regulator, arsenate/arsenite/antimonite-responsive transcriptional repressor
VECSLAECGGIEGLIKQLPSDRVLKARSLVYHAVGDPIRLRILEMLRNQSLCVCIIRSILDISDSKLSYHLNVLKKAGLIEGGKKGNWIIYSITERGREFL